MEVDPLDVKPTEEEPILNGLATTKKSSNAYQKRKNISLASPKEEILEVCMFLLLLVKI